MDSLDVGDVSSDAEFETEKKKKRVHPKKNSTPCGERESEEEVVVKCEYILIVIVKKNVTWKN